MSNVLDAAMRQQFDLFLMRVFGDLHHGAPPLHLAWYLRAICHASTEACARPGARLVINVPPRHLKSVATSVALTAWLLGRDPNVRIMVATYSQDLARLHATQCRTIMQTAWYRRVFPKTVIADDGNRMLEIVTTKGGGRKAVSVGGSVTGHGADVIIVDDCLKADDARSEAKRHEAKEWFNGTLATRLNDVGGGAIISISQRLHEDDLAAHLLERAMTSCAFPRSPSTMNGSPSVRGNGMIAGSAICSTVRRSPARSLRVNDATSACRSIRRSSSRTPSLLKATSFEWNGSAATRRRSSGIATSRSCRAGTPR